MATINGSSSTLVLVTSNTFLTSEGQGLTVRDVVKDILWMWGIQTENQTQPYILRDAIHCMNAALQMIWALAKDANYFSRQTLTLTFNSGESQQTLPENVLTILGPARFASNGQPLMAVPSRPQYDAYGPIYLGAFNYSVPNGTPQAFFVEMLNIQQPDNVTNILHLVPAPSMSTEILLDVSIQCPRYVWSDYTYATPIEMPHKYGDSVLLPFARYKAMDSLLFVQPDRRPTIVEGYQTALKLIGAVDPAMKQVSFAEHATDRAAA